MNLSSNIDLKVLIKDEIYKINNNSNGDINSLDSLGWALLISALDSKGYQLELSKIMGLNSIDELISNLEKK